MNEVDLRKYIDRITEDVVILTKRIEVLEKTECVKFKNEYRK